MGFQFAFEGSNGAGSTFAMNVSEMAVMRELMFQAGAVAHPDLSRSAESAPLASGAAPLRKFLSAEDWLVTPEECATIAVCLMEGGDFDVWGVAMTVVRAMDDLRPWSEVKEWVLGWTEFNGRAAARGGYRVRVRDAFEDAIGEGGVEPERL